MQVLLLAPIILTLLLLANQAAPAQLQASSWDNIPRNIRESKPFKRFEWSYRQRALPYDTLPIRKYLEEKAKAREREKSLSITVTGELQWETIGPAGVNSTWPAHWGELSGRVTAIAVHPSNPDLVYIGAAAGGLWKTTNGGDAWTNLSEEFSSVTFGAIALDPANPEKIYAGTGQAMGYFSDFVYNGTGLFKSTNGGVTWTTVTEGFGSQTHFSSIIVSPHDSNLVLAGLGSGYWHLGNLNNEGVWRSTNAGETWIRTLAVGDVFDVLGDPSDPGRFYAAAGSNNGFFVSTDAGLTWQSRNTNLPDLVVRIHITIAVSNPSILYAVIHDGSISRAYKTTNAGLSWDPISVGVSLGGNYGYGPSDQGWWDLCIAVNPTNPDHVLIGNIELHRTTNGRDFAAVRIPAGSSAWYSPMHVDYQKIVFAPSNPNYIYTGSDGGIFRSTNGGSTWSSRNNQIASLQLYRMSSHPTNSRIMIGGSQDNGLFVTTNAGTTPWDVVMTGDGMECFYDPHDPNTMYASLQSGWLWKSTSGGTFGTWYPITPNYGSTPGWLVPFFMHPTQTHWIYTASKRVWRSTNGGNNWAALTGDLTSSNINAMSQSRVNPGRMILAAGSQVMISNDGGFFWTNVTSNIPGLPRYVSRVVTHPTDETTLFVVRSGFGSGKLYRSTDAGNSWVDLSGNLPDIPHSDFFIDPFYPDEFYVANDFGVYRSTSAGGSWDRQGNGMSHVPALDFDYFYSDSVRLLRVATHGRSAFQAVLRPETFRIAPRRLAFGILLVDSSRTDSLTVINNGTSPLNVVSVQSTHPDYNVAPTSASIEIGASMMFYITFMPTSLGLKRGTIIFTHDAPESMSSVVVTGTGFRDGTFYATTGGPNGGQLLYVDPLTGASTGIGPSGYPQIVSTRVNPPTHELIGLVPSGANHLLVRIDPASGEAFPISTVALSLMKGLAFKADTLYAARLNMIYRVNLNTGSISHVVTTSFLIAGMDFNPLTGELWACARGGIPIDGIYKVDLSSGAATMIGSTGFGEESQDILFNGSGNLFGVHGTSNSRLFRIDTCSGEGTPIGQLGVANVQSLALLPSLLVHPTYAVEPRCPRMGNVIVEESKTDTVVITNNSNADLTVSSVSSDNSAFQITPGSAVVTPGESAKLAVTFSPLDTGLQSATITFSYSGLGSLPNLTPSGRGVLKSIARQIASGWNLVSVPVRLADYSKSAVYPSAHSNAFTFAGGYRHADSLEPGIGYWLKFPAASIVYLAGRLLATDTIPVALHWNIIGTLSQPLPVAAITSDPPEMVLSPFYRYTGSGYETSDMIEPGYGYWVRVNQVGKLILSASSLGISPSNRVQILPVIELPPPAPTEDSYTAHHTPNTPSQYMLEQNYPNPFNPSTSITFQLPVAGFVSLVVHDVLGQEVARLVNEVREAGEYRVGWDAGTRPSGVYTYRLSTGSYSLVKKMLLVR